MNTRDKDIRVLKEGLDILHDTFTDEEVKEIASIMMNAQLRLLAEINSNDKQILDNK